MLFPRNKDTLFQTKNCQSYNKIYTFILDLMFSLRLQ
jgi:hypothetical protein